MARIARIVVPGLPHHVTQRGVRSLNIFRSNQDKQEYLDLLRESGKRFGLTFWSWCLMKNHAHFLVVPEGEDSLAKGMGDAHRRYTRMVNFNEKVRGHLFQARFYSYPVQRDRHAIAVGRYIEMNPVKAGIAKEARNYRWSSARYNTGRKTSDALVEETQLMEISGNWEDVLASAYSKEADKQIESHSSTGRPMGSEEWIEQLEKRTGRQLKAMPSGWPKGKPRAKVLAGNE